jgi:CRP-like cAMP-binding protein
MRDDENKLLDQYMSMREVKRGEVLYLQGAMDRSFYIILF